VPSLRFCYDLFTFLSYLILINPVVGDILQLLDDRFHHLLVTLAKSFDSTPYFLRCYDDLCLKYRSEGCRNAVLIALRRLNDVNDDVCSSMLVGYVLGEIILSRSSLIADIYFIYVFNKWRDSGKGAKLYQCFEDTVKERSASVGVKLAITIRIPMKHCIVNSIVFWKKLGFVGLEDSIFLIKNIK